MLIGYARVSTLDQNLALQRDALKAAGCRRIFADEGVSGSVTARRGLEAALTALSPGDTLVVWKLDRLGRSLPHLVTLIAELGARRVNFRSLSDPIDTASSGGRLVMHIMGALAEFERGLIVERTQAGIQAAKKRGVRLGRRPSLTVAQVEHARALIGRGDSPRAVARTMRVGKSTLYRALKTTDLRRLPNGPATSPTLKRAKVSALPPTSGEGVVNPLDRWDEEGGAPAVPWPLPSYETGDLLDAERRVLECLGVALDVALAESGIRKLERFVNRSQPTET